MSIETFFHSIGAGASHVFKWIFTEEPKVAAAVEKVVIEVETYVGSNKFLSAIATPIETALKTEATAFVTQAKTAIAAGTPVTTMASTISTDLRAAGSTIISSVEATVAPTVAALGGSSSTLKLGLNAAWATFGPQIENFVTSLL
jgi:hypothetical protein